LGARSKRTCGDLGYPDAHRRRAWRYRVLGHPRRRRLGSERRGAADQCWQTRRHGPSATRCRRSWRRGGPVRRFFDLRGEVVRRLTEFANVRAKWKEFPYEPATDGPHDKEEQARLTSLPKNAANRGGLSQRTTVRFGDLLEPRPV